MVCDDLEKTQIKYLAPKSKRRVRYEALSRSSFAATIEGVLSRLVILDEFGVLGKILIAIPASWVSLLDS